jgi:hypothetical protein
MNQSIPKNSFFGATITKAIFYLIMCISSFCHVQAKDFKPLNEEIAKKNLNDSLVMAFTTALKSGDHEKAASLCDAALVKEINETHVSLKAYGEKYFRDMDMSTLVYKVSFKHSPDQPTLKYQLNFSSLKGKKDSLTLYVADVDGKKRLIKNKE